MHTGLPKNRFLIFLDRSLYGKLDAITKSNLHLDLLSGQGHYTICDPDLVHNIIYISILTHQYKNVSLLNSKFYNSNSVSETEKIQHIRTKFSIKIESREKMFEILNLLKNEQKNTIDYLIKHNKLDVLDEANKTAPLISHFNDINLTDTGNNIKKVEEIYKFGGAFRKFEYGHLTMRLPVEEHPAIHDYFRTNVKKYQKNGISDIDDSYTRASLTEKMLRKAISHYVTSFSGITTSPISTSTKKRCNSYFISVWS